jgi:putative Mn2+ efflux pump MntP
MYEQLSGAIIISLLHGLIPSHWLPALALGKKFNWPLRRILLFTLQTASAHAASTLLIGLVVAAGGRYMVGKIENFGTWIPATLLILLGIWFIYRHYRHHHFHVHAETTDSKNVIWPVIVAMFLSPCLEIEGYFFSLGTAGWNWVILLSAFYFITTIFSMLAWVWLAYKGLSRIDSHRWTHNAGIITGLVLVISGMLFLLD